MWLSTINYGKSAFKRTNALSNGKLFVIGTKADKHAFMKQEPYLFVVQK